MPQPERESHIREAEVNTERIPIRPNWNFNDARPCPEYDPVRPESIAVHILTMSMFTPLNILQGGVRMKSAYLHEKSNYYPLFGETNPNCTYRKW